MTKVKVFTCRNNSGDLEAYINNYIRKITDGSKIEIQFSTSQNDCSIYFSALIQVTPQNG